METTTIVISVLIALGLSVVIGILLGVLAKKFEVKGSEKEAAIRACLAGSNCGGCGYAGCDAYAAAVAAGTCAPNLCMAADNQKIGEVLGTEVSAAKRQIAVVRCSGTCGKTNANYDYRDSEDCRIAYLAPGHGSKKCPFGCTGFGTCAQVCPYDAIRIVDGLAVIDEAKCMGCGKCVGVCPNHLIEIIPMDAKYIVRCSSRYKGKTVRSACTDGCLGCGLCQKVCPTGAAEVVGNIAKINQDTCIRCGKCAEKCPAKIIIEVHNVSIRPN